MQQHDQQNKTASSICTKTHITQTTLFKKSAQRRRKHCALAVVRRAKNFRPATDRFPGAREGQNLISWR